MSIGVSIVLGVYNGEDYLRKCLDSIFAQTFKSFELIVVDDGSTDKTVEILDEIDRDDVRVFHRNHEGVSKTYNFGIDNARGVNIAFIAHDDWWGKELLLTLHNAINNTSKIGVVYGDNFKVNDSMNEVLLPEYNYNKLKKECYINASCVMIRKGVLDRLHIQDGYYFDESLKSAMDWDLWIRLSELCEFKHVAKTLCYRKCHLKQVSRTFKHVQDRWKIFKRYNKITFKDFINMYFLPLLILGKIGFLYRDRSSYRGEKYIKIPKYVLHLLLEIEEKIKREESAEE